MKKILASFMVFGLAVAALTGCGGNKATIDTMELKIGVSTGEDDPRNIAAKEFADEIAAKTGGKL
ncbi:MAG: hypothetical protein II156_00115, partial [Lachnospiraceae bacterium]|nr:hypothetical protein [Lachnospiraceae bacterium]